MDEMDRKVLEALQPKRVFKWYTQLPRNADGWWVKIRQLVPGDRNLPTRYAHLELAGEEDTEFRSHVSRYRRWTMIENEFQVHYAMDFDGIPFSSHLFNPDEENAGETRILTIGRNGVQ